MKHRAIIIFGDGIGGHADTDGKELLSFLRKEKETLNERLLNQYSVAQRSFSNEEELDAFLQVIGLLDYECSDTAVYTDDNVIKEVLDLFGLMEVKNSSPYEKQLKGIAAHLKEITESGWIPFASPNPSSREKTMKDEVLKAILHLENAIELTKKY